MEELTCQFTVLIAVIVRLSSVCGAVTTGRDVSEQSVSCISLEIDLCQNLKVYNGTSLPNIFGHQSQKQSERTLYNYKDALNVECSSELLPFLCSVYLPPCEGDRRVPLPCRDWCYSVQDQCSRVFGDTGFQWRDEFQCDMLPDTTGEACLSYRDLRNIHRPRPESHPGDSVFRDSPKGTVIEYDFSEDDVTATVSPVLRRRYDIIDLGDPLYYRGWADVQGSGAANDYCRVVGKKKRRFLSCAVAGSSGQEHFYVSRMGVDLGYNNTWFMRDLDGDGRDDYCRCVGEKPRTRISCMKAGQQGFYGGPLQTGDQYTFDIPASDNCHDKPLNPFHGV